MVGKGLSPAAKDRSFAARISQARSESHSRNQNREFLVALKVKLDAAELRELDALAHETNPEMFFEALLAFGRRLEYAGKLEPAAGIYSSILTAQPSLPFIGIRQRAERCLAALQGRGSNELRAEVLLKGFAEQATDYRTIVPMLSGSVAYGLTRTAFLGRFAGLGRTGKLASTAVGTAMEVPVFAGLSHVLSGGRGRNFGAELARAGSTLGAMKLMAGVTRLGRQGLPGGLVTQAATFTGLMGAHALEVKLGLRPRVDGATTVSDTLAAMVSLGVGAHLGRRILGPRFAAFQQELAVRGEVSFRPTRPSWLEIRTKLLASGGLQDLRFLPPPASAGAGYPLAGLGRGARIPGQFHLMAKTKGAPDQGTAPRRKKNGAEKPVRLRDYQVEMLQGLRENLKGNSSWLGLASPMQTGKSFLIRYILAEAETVYGPETQFLVLSSARVITDQLIGDLLGGGLGEVGRLDGLVKDPNRTTVASIYTLCQSRFLCLFPEKAGVRYVLIMDEAYFTQSPIVRKILNHFGLIENVRRDGGNLYRPKTAPHARLIGLSGTAFGLEGYHLSGQLDILNALQGNWIRPMIGERVYPQIETHEIKRGTERMIWWVATQAYAEYLAEIYDQKIQGKYPKPLVYVPTIAHGELLKTSLQKRYGSDGVQFVHSKLSPEEIQTRLEFWEEEGGILLSVRMLSHGFRGTGAGAVFHTYQTSSPELFAQRTGRAWGVDPTRVLPPLYVLESTWDRERFSNLARILGLVDYPRDRLLIDASLLEKVRSIQHRRSWEEVLADQVRAGKVAPYFARMPVLESWRIFFHGWLTRWGRLEVAAATGIAEEILFGFQLGALPSRLKEIEALATVENTREEWIERWVRAWETAVDESIQGLRQLPFSWGAGLLAWRQGEGNPEQKAERLDELLKKLVPATATKARIIDRRRLMEALKEALKAAKTSGEKITPTALATRAHAIYIQGITEDLWPRLDTFRQILRGKFANEGIMALLENSGIVKKRPQTFLDPRRLMDSFQSAVEEAEQSGEKITPTALATRAHAIYIQELSQGSRPSLNTFRNIIRGKNADEKILALLEKSEIVERRLSLDRPRLMKSFQSAVREAEQSGEKLTPTALATRAHEIYSRGLADTAQSSAGTFQQLVTGKTRDEKILALLEKSGVVEKRVALDHQRLRDAFQSAIEEIKNAGQRTNLTAIYTRAREIYIQGLNEGSHPSRSTFMQVVCGKRVNREILDLLENSGVVEKRFQVRLGRQRMMDSFRNAIQEAKQSGKRISLKQLAKIAHRIYVGGLDEGSQSSLSRFQHLVSGKRADPEVLALIKAEFLVEPFSV